MATGHRASGASPLMIVATTPSRTLRMSSATSDRPTIPALLFSITNLAETLI
jgi:hypothetical protein